VTAAGGVLAATAQDWATWLGIPTAIIVATVGPLIQRRAQERRDQAERERQKQLGEGSYVGTLIKGYEGRIGELREQIVSDKKECQDEIAQVRVECEQRVAEAQRRHDAKLAELERHVAEQDREHQRDRDRWERERNDLYRQMFRGGRTSNPDDKTPPPEGKR
jgi:preprotein translocase subunit YajC